jgi:hypothetical protein
MPTPIGGLIFFILKLRLLSTLDMTWIQEDPLTLSLSLLVTLSDSIVR